MGVEESILKDYNEALKAQDKPRLETLRLLRSSLKNAQIEKGGPLEDEEVYAVISREVKRRKEAQEMYLQARRHDLAAREEAEIEIMSAYLPRPLDETALREMIEAVIQELGAGPRDMGKVMAALMPRVKGRADGKRVQELVRHALS